MFMNVPLVGVPRMGDATGVVRTAQERLRARKERALWRAGRWHGHVLGTVGTLLVQLDRRFPGGGRMSETLFDRASAEPSRIPPLEAAPFGSVRMGVVLAAGRSERLVNVTAGGSKALVRIGGLALVERAVRGLLAEGLERVVVVVGYQAGPVAAVVDRLAPRRVRAAFAEDWALGNGVSLAAAEPHVRDGELFL